MSHPHIWYKYWVFDLYGGDVSKNNQNSWLDELERASKTTMWASKLTEFLGGEDRLRATLPSEFGPSDAFSPVNDGDGSRVFRAFEQLNPSEVKYLVLGKDPYSHKSGAATGLAFLVDEGIRLQGRLRGAGKSLDNLRGKLFPEAGEVPNDKLEEWSRRQGMLLLNSALTIPANGKSGDDLKAWTGFTQVVIRYLVVGKHLSIKRVCAVGRHAEGILLGAGLNPPPNRGDCYYVHPSPNHLDKEKFDKSWGRDRWPPP